jgi:hypothetical protein
MELDLRFLKHLSAKTTQNSKQVNNKTQENISSIFSKKSKKLKKPQNQAILETCSNLKWRKESSAQFAKK